MEDVARGAENVLRLNRAEIVEGVRLSPAVVVKFKETLRVVQRAPFAGSAGGGGGGLKRHAAILENKLEGFIGEEQYGFLGWVRP